MKRKNMPPRLTLLLICGFIILVSTSAWMRGCKNAAKSTDEAAAAAKTATHNADDEARIAAEAVKSSDPALSTLPIVVDPASRPKKGTVVKDPNGGYYFNDQYYKRFESIPFESKSDVFLDQPLTGENAAHLLERNVKFVYNSDAYRQQGNKQYQIVFLISDDIQTTSNLYDIDESHAKNLIEMCHDLPQSVLRASSKQEMLKMQEAILQKDAIPVLVFHNNVNADFLSKLDDQSNIITCNSFSVNPNALLTSTDFLDMGAIAEGISTASEASNLMDFYRQFSSIYYTHMSDKHQYYTLVYVGVGGTILTGVGAVAYYGNSNKSSL